MKKQLPKFFQGTPEAQNMLFKHILRPASAAKELGKCATRDRVAMQG